jgi:hypothetical protein
MRPWNGANGEPYCATKHANAVGSFATTEAATRNASASLCMN